MNYLITGVNHKTAPVALRERLACDDTRVREMLGHMRQSRVVQEAAILSTCNRVEIYSATDEPQSAQDEIIQVMLDGKNASREDLAGHIYTKEGSEAVAHLFSVTASLDSQVVGENQIAGQVKNALDLARESNAVGTHLNRLFNRALFVAKRVRTETAISRGNVSVGSAGVVLARRIFGDLSDKSVVLLGAGEIGELCLRYLHDQGGAQVKIVNRTLERAQTLADQGLGSAVPLEDFSEVLAEADILITSVSEELSRLGFDVHGFSDLMTKRQNAPLFIIDLGLPRNVDARVGDLDNIYLYNLDDLQTVASEGESARAAAAVAAKNLIDEEVRLFYENNLVQGAGADIARLGRKFEEIRQAELARSLGRLTHLNETDRLAIDKLTQALMSRLLHDPILSLRSDAIRTEPRFVEIFRQLFRLNDEEE